MNKQGQEALGGLGMIVMIFITILLGAIFLQVIAQSVGESVNTIEIANESIDTVVNGTAQYLDYRALSDVVIWNETNDIIIGSGNYTITNNVVNPTTGALNVRILPDATEVWKTAWQVSATAQPQTYIADGGARAMATLIIVMFALAILAVVIGPAISREFLSMGR